MNPYVQALHDLDAGDFEVQDGFEIDFLTHNLRRVHRDGERTYFSDKQKGVIRSMAETYLGPQYVAEMQGQLQLV